MQNVVLGVVMASVGLAVFGYLAGLLWQASSGPVLVLLERKRLRRREELLAQGDDALQRDDMVGALRAFTAAIYTSPARSASFAAEVERHHTGLLSRFIAAADRSHGGNVGLLSLALADRVLKKRRSLQASYVAALQTGKNRRVLERELAANASELRKAVHALADEVMNASGPAAMH